MNPFLVYGYGVLISDIKQTTLFPPTERIVVEFQNQILAGKIEVTFKNQIF